MFRNENGREFMSETLTFTADCFAFCKRLGPTFVNLAWMFAGMNNAAGADASQDSMQVKVNRTVPSVAPPRTSLFFSANPTTQELFRAHVFQEPLVVVGGEPTAAENSALAGALLDYSKRSEPDDFSALTDFLAGHPQSPWAAALLTDLGFEYYNTAHYSLAIDAWSQAWALAKNATDRKALALVDRAFGELIHMDSRLGRMDEIEMLLKSAAKHPMLGPAAQRVAEAREALWNMQNRPEISFRCGPLALRSIRMALHMDGSSDAEILKSASTQKGCSLPQVADLSKKIGLNYQMAFRDKGEFVVPSVVHWKVGHYAAMVRKAGELYELNDPTFGNKTWATKEALEAETSGYFLVAAGTLPAGWRSVDEKEGAGVWGKGLPNGYSDQNCTKKDIATRSCPLNAMAVAKVHLMEVNLNLADQPVGYTPPVGPPVRFTVRYNQRDVFQPANFFYANLGPQWTFDWLTYITDNPTNSLADVNLYVGGGGQRTYTDFDTNTQSFAYQQYDQNLLTRTGPSSYQLLSGDGSKLIFGQSDGAIGTARNIFLTQEVDPQGNAITMTYDTNLCLVAVTDAIGQVTTLTYGLPETNFVSPLNGVVSVVPADPYKLTKVTDPFGRFATFNYEPQLVEKTVTVDGGLTFTYAWGGLASDTDVIGITSQFGYYSIVSATNSPVIFAISSFVNSLTTPYGTTSFSTTFNNGVLDNGLTRVMEITYPDGSLERVEANQTINLSTSDPIANVPLGMLTDNDYLQFRNTYYWDRTACALAYRDYSKARIYHFCHTETLGGAVSGSLESFKPPLEGRVWYDYPGQTIGNIIGSNNVPTHIGRVLDDGTTQLYTYAYDGFGHITNSIDPVGRTLSMIYDTNGIDLLEVRQTRAGNNELLSKLTYNSQHRPLTATDAAGQTTALTWNSRGQLLFFTDPKHETTTYTYDTNGYLLSIDGPLPGTNDTVSATYDAFGRVRTLTDVNGYTIAYAYDNLNRATNLTYPDGTFAQYTFNLLDCAAFQDRASRQTFFAHDNMRQLTTMTDPLGRVTRFEWCRCGAPKALIDPMGRKTSWSMDVQGRTAIKQYADGSQLNNLYENTTSRLQRLVDEKQQSTLFAYNADDTLASINYANAAVATPPVSFTYDQSYQRPVSVTDGIGATTYSYVPITSPPVLGAGRLETLAGPLTNSTTVYGYDELGRPVQMSVDGSLSTRAFDAAGRITSASNALGSFTYAYDGVSIRVVSESYPNGLATAASYGSNLQDFTLQKLAYSVGAAPVSQFTYGYDIDRTQITNWSQQAAAQAPSVFTLGYDAVNQLLFAWVTNSGSLANSFGYSYDLAGNRLTETIAGSGSTASYNSLNQLSTSDNPASVARTNQWDAQNRLVATSFGNQTAQFGYDGASRPVYIRELQDGSQVSLRYFVWRNDRLCEERDATGTNITKRFYWQGVALEAGTNAGRYYYTRDHLGSIREMTDALGNVRARYSYDPFGRQTQLAGDLTADFGFGGMFWSPEASLALTHFRAYDPQLGRWLSRDPLPDGERKEGPNLYAYVRNNPISGIDPTGLACLDTVSCTCEQQPCTCAMAGLQTAARVTTAVAPVVAAGAKAVEAAGGPEAVGEDLANLGEGCLAAAEGGGGQAIAQAVQSGGAQFVTQVSQAVSTPAVNAVANTVVANTEVAPPNFGAQLYQLGQMADTLPWEWDRVESMVEISERLHALDYWYELDFDMMQQMWQYALSQWNAGALNEQFWADIQ
jgi:RHS repeat-associated protein